MKLYNILLKEFAKAQLGYAAIAIIGQSCLGSIAIMLALMSDLPMGVKFGFLFLVTIFCMAFNAAVLAQLRSKTTFNLLILSVLFSMFVIVFQWV